MSCCGSSRLELNARGQFDVSGVGACALPADLAVAVIACVQDVVARVPGADVVECVKRVGTELDRHLFLDGDRFRYRQIGVEERRPEVGVPARVTDLIQPREGEDLPVGSVIEERVTS